MDYEILVSNLQTKSSELDSLTGKIGSLVNDFESSLSSMSGTEISGLYSSLSTSLERLNRGYNNCGTWFTEYLTGLNELESSLASFNCQNIDSPKEFTGRFEDLFGKRVIPTLKSNGDVGANLNLGEKKTVVKSAMQWAIAIANDDSYGYSQATRWGNPNYDCSSLVISAYKAAGVDVNATYTGDMKQGFLNTGQFEWIQGPVDVSSLQPGDILLNEANHTEMYVGDGQNVGAQDNFDGYDGDSAGNEINIQGYWDDNWDGVLRYVA